LSPVTKPLVRRCNQPFIYVTIDSRGNYLLCCQDNMGETSGKFGSVHEGIPGFKRFWYGEEMQRIRRRLRGKNRAGTSGIGRSKRSISSGTARNGSRSHQIRSIMATTKKKAAKAKKAAPKAAAKAKGYTVEVVPLTSLKAHPKNYRTHPEDQLAHIKASLQEHGFYRNIVVARDGTILAGHGVSEAAAALKIASVPIVRLDIDADDPRALKLLAGDNEIGKLAEVDDRALTELLKGLHEIDAGALLGTGFDAQMLAALTFVTRPADEIETMNAANEWLGLPSYDEGDYQIKLVITFPDEKAREQYVSEMKLRIDKKVEAGAHTWATRWPWTDRTDATAVRFEGKKEVARKDA